MSLGREYANEIAIAQLESIARSEQLEYEAKQNLEKGLWKVRGGELLKIQEMTSSHIENCIKMLGDNYCNLPLKKEYTKAFEKELKDRAKAKER